MKSELLISLYRRGLNKVTDELNAYPTEDSLWENLPGTINTGGSLAQHLIGNLKTFIGNPFGNINYERNRAAEFSERLFTREELVSGLQAVAEIIDHSLIQLSEEQLAEEYPVELKTFGPHQTVEFAIVYLLDHLAYHAGQINYHRRYISTKVAGN